MRILVAGCSLTSGYGFADEINDKDIWPNILAKNLDAEIDNVSVAGNSNEFIFLNLLEKLYSSKEEYDYIFYQATSLGRVILTPNWHTKATISEYNNSNGMVSDKDYKKFHSTFLTLNQLWGHWRRLVQVLNTIQSLAVNHNILVINGAISGISKEFVNGDRTPFLDSIIDVNNLPDNEIYKASELIKQDIDSINFDYWVNPYNSFVRQQVDTCPLDGDNHPGAITHANFAKMLLEYLK
jgi:hypothetical protein